MINRRWLILFLAAPALLLTTAVLASVGIGEITHRFTGAAECLILDPVAGTILINENVEPGDRFYLDQFITNSCESNITVEIRLDVPTEFSWIEVDETDDVGDFQLSPGELFHARTMVTFGNDTPAEFSAKDIKWKIARPE